ncbi:MAG: TonB family protein [Acidobacteria bacterium]|nr:TonB family protein [Acidobacteriota bacterium]
MFDVLVESSKRKSGKRASRYFVVTTAIYAVALLALGVGTIIGFSPALAEEYNLAAMLAPPPLPNNPKPMDQPKPIANIKSEVDPGFIAPTKVPKEIPDPNKVAPRINVRAPIGPFDPNMPFSSGAGGPKIGSDGDGDRTPPPPPPPQPTPEPKKPETKLPTATKVSEGVLQGSALKRQVPVYTQIAKTARASGPVQVVVTISEEGRVIEANAVNGNPLLRQAAVDAARQWVFSPTKLSGVPVKVQGVLTFNFVLQ